MLDGSKLDETTRVLIEARENLVQRGWTINSLERADGAVCAIGAIAKVYASDGHVIRGFMKIPNDCQAIERLHRVMPDADRSHRRGFLMHWFNVVNFNDAQTSVEPVLELFDRAIAAGIE